MRVGREKEQETEGATQLEEVAASFSSMQRQLRQAVETMTPLLQPTSITELHVPAGQLITVSIIRIDTL